MGFTEAELGFVLAAVFAALAMSGLVVQKNQAAERLTKAGLVARDDSLAHRIDSVSKAFKDFRDSVRKKSNKIPRCSEKGESPAAIAVLRVLGADAYEMDGERVNFAGLESRLTAQIAREQELGCRYLVQTIATSGVDGPDHSTAIGKLWTHFDVSERHGR
jgi:hypothetical protein